MKTSLITIIVTIATLSLGSQDFRNTTWGMSPNEVKSNETSELIEESSDLLVYLTTLAGYEVYAGYIFIDGKLTRGKYIVLEEYSNKNAYISDYEFLNSLLRKKYGKPVEEEIYWITDNNSLNRDKSDWGHAIFKGDLILYSTYKTSTTEITITLGSEDFDIINEIEYSSMNDELRKMEEEKLLDGF